jgi:hypothetical protein
MTDQTTYSLPPATFAFGEGPSTGWATAPSRTPGRGCGVSLPIGTRASPCSGGLLNWGSTSSTPPTPPVPR